MLIDSFFVLFWGLCDDSDSLEMTGKEEEEGGQHAAKGYRVGFKPWAVLGAHALPIELPVFPRDSKLDRSGSPSNSRVT